MMNNNKILTVSYGTFSCTLEGFDDSFGTMKAIAEYFRDLAADDRYFGAEPPQPDADMLARIAQKEVSRRVEAREQDGKIVLSALEDQRVEAAEAPSAMTAGAVGLAALAKNDPVDARPVVTEEPIIAKDVEGATQDAAEIQATVAEVEESIEIATEATDLDTADLDVKQDTLIEEIEDAAEVAEVETDLQPIVEDGVADSVVEVTQESDAVDSDVAEDVKVDPVFSEDENDIVPGQPDADVEAFFADSPVPQAETADHGVADDVPLAKIVAPKPEAPAPDSIAAKLQRIRAVVAQHEEADEDEDYLEDQHVEDAATGETQVDEPQVEDTAANEDDTNAAEDLIADARADIEEALDADEATTVEAEIAPEEDAKAADEDDVSAILSRLEAHGQETSTKAVAEVDVPEALDDVNLSDLDDTAGSPSVEDTVSNLFDAEDALAEEAVVEPAAPKVTLRRKPRVTPSQELEVEAETPVETDKAAPRARVIKVKRADLEAAIEQGDLEEYDAEPETADVAPKQDEKPAAKSAPEQTRKLDDLAPSRNKKRTALSPEDEDELARELAELEDDISAGAPAQDVTPKRPLRRDASAARNALPSIDESNETDVNRLLAETDHQMDEPESATRRDAFAHLRAAVAAKKADVAMGDDGKDEDSDGAYREDLAEVVRPRRPVSGAARTERPSDARPAPLKLVAEQRIDVAQAAATAGPVRPRRISAAAAEEAAPAHDGESFSDFATDMGAATLPQLLEAAAAYMSFVEGREQFSRPQLMTKVRQAGGPDGFSREEGLRSFGQLLRAGKIEKIKGGRFTVSDDIGYRPDERAAG